MRLVLVLTSFIIADYCFSQGTECDSLIKEPNKIISTLATEASDIAFGEIAEFRLDSCILPFLPLSMEAEDFFEEKVRRNIACSQLERLIAIPLIVGTDSIDRFVRLIIFRVNTDPTSHLLYEINSDYFFISKTFHADSNMLISCSREVTVKDFVFVFDALDKFFWKHDGFIENDDEYSFYHDLSYVIKGYQGGEYNVVEGS
ncbi:MAG: hypothetical protein JXR10_09715 [Cyclobacteriaceae bacterium]